MRTLILGLLVTASVQAFAGRDCYPPWGGVVQDGFSVQAYKEQRPTGGERCEYEWRTCRDGFLSGWYRYSSCQEDYNCYGTEFGTVYHMQTVTAYLNSIENGRPCQSEYRQCYYGRLTGSYRYSYCTSYP